MFSTLAFNCLTAMVRAGKVKEEQAHQHHQLLFLELEFFMENGQDTLAGGNQMEHTIPYGIKQFFGKDTDFIRIICNFASESTVM